MKSDKPQPGRISINKKNPPDNAPQVTQAFLHQAKKLREHAERLNKIDAFFQTPDVESMSKAEIVNMAHELQVHHIELQLQNEEMQFIQSELEASRSKYFELY